MDRDIVEIVVVAILVAAVFFGFVRERMSPDVVGMIAVAVLLATDILGTEEVLRVFSNSAPITIASLFVMSAALERTGVIDAIGQRVTEFAGRGPRRAVAALLLAAVAASAFVNNTPIVVILTPVTIALAARLKLAPSRLLIPLSYASILGGTCTLIGTSTNILVDGVAQRRGLAAFGMFEITGAGLLFAAVGLAYLWLTARWLLPDRETFANLLADMPQRQFLAEVLVPGDSPLVGLPVGQVAEKRAARVIDLVRDDRSRRPLAEDTVIEAGDRLVLRLNVGDVMGMRETEEVVFEARSPHLWEPIATRSTVVVEGIVGPRSRWVGRRVADLNLRRGYGAYILAVHRQGENVGRNFDEVRLQFGDTLLLEGPPEGLRRLFEAGQMVNLSAPSEQPFRRGKGWIAIAAILLVVGLAAVEVLPIAALALMGATAVVALGCLSAEEAYESIRWRILVLIFAMLAVGTAMEKTGAAALLVQYLAQAAAGFGPLAMLAMLYLLTSLLTELISNNAAAILLTPIAVALAEQLGVDPRPFAVAVMFAASASFATPIGYQTNTFVYGAGGYRFTDFLRIGVPMNLLMWATAVLVIPLFWPFQ